VDRLRGHGPVVAALVIGCVLGFLARSLVDLGGAGLLAVIGVVAAVSLAALTDVVADALRRVTTFLAKLAMGSLPGRRRLSARQLGQTRVLDHLEGQTFTRERWIDLNEFDHRGYAYGVARSRTYIPLYGNGLARLEQVEISCPPGLAALDPAAATAIGAKVDELVRESAEIGRPFGDDPMVRLRTWTPPVNGRERLLISADRVGYRHYAAVARLLVEDFDGKLRDRFEISPRQLVNPLVCGVLGVEVAVVTSDGKLVLAHRGDLALEYRNQIVVSVGKALSVLEDADPSDPGRIDPARTVTRAVRGELGIDVDGARCNFMALGLETTRMDPDLLGYVEVEQTAADVRAAFIGAQVRDRWETRTLSFSEFSPDGVADLVSRHGDQLTPATAMNLVFAVSDKFGERACQAAMVR
jgi:hypothetical protein